MREDFLHYCWQYGLFNQNNLRTEDGNPLRIFVRGMLNTNSGPDFNNVRIFIGPTEWAGTAEIHVKASDWEKHKHQDDKAYDNVVLHVVYEADKPIYRQNGELIPTLQLKGRIDESLYSRYDSLLENKTDFPCQNTIKHVDDFVMDAWIERLLVERMEDKSSIILDTLKQNNNDWSATFYQYLARNFGLKINAEPFEWLARAMPQQYLAKHKDNLLQVEAMLYGQAGLLEGDFEEEYPNQLKKEYQFFQQKFDLKPIEGSAWKFMRTRPVNFPTICISQLAALIHQSDNLFSKVLETGSLEDLQGFFKVKASTYWDTHYVFGKESEEQKKGLGKSAINNLIINAVVPMVFVYGMHKDEAFYKQRAIDILEQLAVENNSIITNFVEAGVKAPSAFQSQALLQLYKQYCSPKKCLNCQVGNQIVQGKI